MTSYHIRSDNTPGLCQADKKSCPLGGIHFDSERDARLYAEIRIAKAVSSEGGIKSRFTGAELRDMFVRNPKMNWNHPLGTLLISRRGALWELKDREEISGMDRRFKLRAMNSGKAVTVVTSANLRREGERAPEDFAQFLPASHMVDGPAIWTKDKIKPLPEGYSNFKNVVLSKINLSTNRSHEEEQLRMFRAFSDDPEMTKDIFGKDVSAPEVRYLIAPEAPVEGENGSKDFLLENSAAAWALAGRSPEEWEKASQWEREKFFTSKRIKSATFLSRGGKVSFVNNDLAPGLFDSFLAKAAESRDVAVFSRDNLDLIERSD